MTVPMRRLALRQVIYRRSFFSWAGTKSEPEPPRYDFVKPMKAQDPRGRIEFMPPYDVAPGAMGSILSKALKNNTIDGEVLDEEIHCVPFWTMMYTTAWSGEKVDKSSESRVGPLRIDFGFSVAAVGADHWAHGIVLPDSAWQLYEERIRALYHSPPRMDAEGNVLLSDWFRGHRIPEENVAPFVKGYPVITNESITKPLARAIAVAAQAVDNAENGKQETRPERDNWVVKITERIRTYAIPNYRVVYKSSSSTGSLFRDGLYCLEPDIGSAHFFALSKDVPRISRGPPEEGSPALYPFMAMTNRNEFLGETVDNDYDMITPMSLCVTPEDIDMFARDVCKATNRAKLDWNDPNIFSSSLTAPTPNIVQVMRLAAYRSFKFPDPPPVHAFDNAGGLPQSTAASRKNPAPAATKGKVTLMPARAQKTPVVMQDPRNYYKLLEITPDNSFLEASQDKAVTEKLDRSRRISRFLLRPQKADEGLAEGADRYARIFDEAYEALNTVTKRKAYQRSEL